MKCSNCSYENADKDKYCTNCGTKLRNKYRIWLISNINFFLMPIICFVFYGCALLVGLTDSYNSKVVGWLVNNCDFIVRYYFIFSFLFFFYGIYDRVRDDKKKVKMFWTIMLGLCLFIEFYIYLLRRIIG